jgi:hypothetical protein
MFAKRPDGVIVNTRHRKNLVEDFMSGKIHPMRWAKPNAGNRKP